MNREEYLKLRNNKDLGEICYSFYKIKAEEKNFKVYNIDTFIEAFNMWIRLSKDSVEQATTYFDNLFTVQTTMLNKKEIKYS